MHWDFASLNSLGLNLVVASSKTRNECRISFPTFNGKNEKPQAYADTHVCVRCYDPEQMQGKTFTVALMCVWNRNAPCHPLAPAGRCSLLYSALKQLFSVTLAEEVNTLVLFSASIYSHPNIVNREITFHPLITTGFAPTNH